VPDIKIHPRRIAVQSARYYARGDRTITHAS